MPTAQTIFALPGAAGAKRYQRNADARTCVAHVVHGHLMSQPQEQALFRIRALAQSVTESEENANDLVDLLKYLQVSSEAAARFYD